MTTRLTVTDDGSARYVLLKGNVRDWLRDNKIPAVYAPTEHGWRLRRERLADVLALADAHGIAATLRGGGR